jgi:tetratricopeptide (TPR) repeat protein
VLSNNIPQIQLNRMSPQDSLDLLAALAEKAELPLTRVQFDALASWVKGHPWTARYAIDLIGQYSFDFVDETSRVTSIRESFFIAELDSRGAFSDFQRKMLRILAEYAPLPARVLAKVLGTEQTLFYSQLEPLLDRALIVIDDGRYRVADPISDAVLRRFGREPIDHRALYDAIRLELASADEEDRRLDLENLAWSAAVAAGLRDEVSKYVALASTRISAARRAFHARQYTEALRLADAALVIRDEEYELRSIKVRCLARLERFGEAFGVIDELRTRSQLRTAFYLTGYVQQLQRRYRESVDSFREALRLGTPWPTLHFELAESLYEMGEYKDAEHFARLAHDKDPNSFVLDLLVRIEIKLESIAKADTYLRELSIYDRSPYYVYRRSCVEFAKGEYQQAAASASLAYKTLSGQPHVVVQYIKSQIRAGGFTKAEKGLKALKRFAEADYADTVTGLEVQLLSAKERYEDALLLWEQIGEKDKPVNLAIRREALAGFLKSLPPTNPLHGGMSRQLHEIDASLGARKLPLLLASLE